MQARSLLVYEPAEGLDERLEVALYRGVGGKQAGITADALHMLQGLADGQHRLQGGGRAGQGVGLRGVGAAAAAAAAT